MYTELEAFEKRIHNSNAKFFQAEQEIESLKQQLKLEKAINEDMETARPSVVHRVHFQRMEGQLKESQNALETKEEEIAILRSTLSSKEAKIEELSKAKTSAEEATTRTEQEKNELQKSVTQLENTKEQLMLDHERLAKHRLRTRTTSAERTHSSARSSGATLTTEQASSSQEPPLPSRPVSLVPTLATNSIQQTPERLVRRDPVNRQSLIVNEMPPPELRAERRKSMTLKGFMKKLVGKDEVVESNASKAAKRENRKSLPLTDRPRTATMPKGKHVPVRSESAAYNLASIRDESATVATPAPTEVIDFATHNAAARPQTATSEKGEREADVAKARPKSRGWGVS